MAPSPHTSQVLNYAGLSARVSDAVSPLLLEYEVAVSSHPTTIVTCRHLHQKLSMCLHEIDMIHISKMRLVGFFNATLSSTLEMVPLIAAHLPRRFPVPQTSHLPSICVKCSLAFHPGPLPDSPRLRPGISVIINAAWCAITVCFLFLFVFLK